MVHKLFGNSSHSTPRCEADEHVETEKLADVDLTLPWGVYVPPSLHQAQRSEKPMQDDDDGQVFECSQEGYFRIVNSRGKFFQCGFSRSLGRATELSGVKRRICVKISDVDVEEKSDDMLGAEHDSPTPTKITEERLHPEEALFLCMRGLLRIESPTNSTTFISIEPRMHATMSVQVLFNDMLRECNIPLTAYLAYSHLRDQGYILMRYTKNRMKLLFTMNDKGSRRREKWSVESKEISAPGNVHEDFESKNLGIDEECNKQWSLPSDDNQVKVVSETGVHEPSFSCDIRQQRLNRRKIKLGDDLMRASPPCIVSCGNGRYSDDRGVNNSTVQLAYYAYKPNAQFKRTNPGLPDFGVAILPYHSHGDQGPTFDTLVSLLSLCQENYEHSAESDVPDHGRCPLRIVTVSDSGAVIAFGVTTGDVPHVDH